MRPTITPARDLAEAKVQVLKMLQASVDGRWTDEYEEGGDGGWRTAEAGVLREVAALLGASSEEIKAQDRHTLCPRHNSHACSFCMHACKHCWKDFGTWKGNHESYLFG